MAGKASTRARSVFGRRVLTVGVLVLLAVWMRECSAPITWGLSGDPSVDQSWSARMRGAYPDGASETWLVWSLRAQGFRVEPEHRTATFEAPVVPVCVFHYTVDWSPAGDGRVRDVRGRVLDACV